MDRSFEAPTTGPHEHRRRTSDHSRLLARQPLTRALPTQDVVLRSARAIPAVTVHSPVSTGPAPLLPKFARGALESRDLPQKISLSYRATSGCSPILSAPQTRVISPATDTTNPRPLSLPQVRAHPLGATASVMSSTGSAFTRPPTSLSTGGSDVSSPSAYSSATTPLSTAGYASTPLSTGGRSPLYSAESGHLQGAVCPAHTDMLRLTARERDVLREINNRIAALAETGPTAPMDLDCNATATQPESRPFTPVHIPPGFEEGLANHFDGTFNPRSPHRRHRRGTRVSLAEDASPGPGSRRPLTPESRPLTPIPIPPNFAHDIQEYFKASMEPRSPESCRRRAEHREKAATARDRELLPVASESQSDDWPSSPETPPLEDDDDSNLSDDPIEVIEGVLRAEYEKLLWNASASRSSFGDPAASVAVDYRAEDNVGGAPVGRRLRPAPVNVARKMAFDDRQARSTADERRAMCSRWLLGLEPALLGRPVVSASWP